MALNEIETFLAALRRVETGSYAGLYQVRAGDTGAIGAYQIRPENWVEWTTEALMPTADWRDPAVQDHVARTKAAELYRRYGNWDLVALYWFAGEVVADYAAAQGGVRAVGGLTDARGIPAGTYVEAVTDQMAQAPAVYKQQARKMGMLAHEFVDAEPPVRPPTPEDAPYVGPKAAAGGARQRDIDAELREWIAQLEALEEAAQPPQSPIHDRLVRALDTVSRAVAGGERTLAGITETEAQVPELEPVGPPGRT